MATTHRSYVTATITIAANDLRRRLRDRSAIVQAVVAPIALAALIGLAFGQGFELEATVAVVDSDGSELSAGIVEGLASGLDEESPLSFERVEDAEEARTRVGDDLAGVIVFPSGFASSLAGDDPLGLTVIVDRSDQILADVVTAIGGGLAAQVDAGRLAVATALERAASSPDADPEVAARVLEEVGKVRTPVVIEPRDVSGTWNAVTYFAPSMSIVFLFLSLGTAARSLLVERRSGTLARVRAAPVTGAALLTGKSASTFVLGLVAMLTVWAVTAAVFGADWGDPVGVLLVIVAVSWAITGFGILVTGVSRTEAQADGLANSLAFIFALLGGNFITPGNMPDVLERLTLLTPNGWALDSFTLLAAGEAVPADVAGGVAVLVAMGSVGAAVGLVVAGRGLRA